MHHVLTLLILLICLIPAEAQVIWQEQFDTTDGVTNDLGTTAWSIDVSGCSIAAGDYFEVRNGQFAAKETDCEAEWISEWIDISSAGTVTLSLDITGVGGLETTGGFQDYLKAYYELDGGAETLFAADSGVVDYSTLGTCNSGISGDSIRLRIKVFTTGDDEIYTFDNVTVASDSGSNISTAAERLFTRQSGNWNATSTWSTSPGGASCACTPTSTSEVYITDGCYVDLNVDGVVNEIHVLRGALVNWSAGNVDLDINGTGKIEVADGARMDESGQAVARIRFVSANTSTVNIYDVDEGIEVDDIRFEAASTVTFGGTGRVFIDDDLEIVAAADISIQNSGYFEVDDDVLFNAANASLTIADSFEVNSDFDANNADNSEMIITANGVAIFNDDVLGSDNSDNFTVENSGYVFINDDLTQSPAGATACEWYNFANSTLILNHNNAETDWQIFANYADNLVNYARPGDQPFIFTPQDAYWNLSLSGSGTKTTLANLDINGNLSIEGTASFNTDTNNDTINLAGNWSNTSTNANPFVEGTERVIFDGAADQTITASNIGTETFFQLEVNKSGGNLILTDDVSLSGNCFFTLGDIVTTSTDILTLVDNATVSGSSDASHVNGPLVKIGNDAFTFPTGDGTNYRGIGISAPAATGDEFEAQYFSASGYGTYGGWGSWPTSINRVSNIEHWTLDRNVGTSAVEVTLNWGNNSDVGDTADLVVARYNTGTSQWVNEGVTAVTGNNSAGSITSATVTNFSPFTLGSTTSANPLPILINSFDVALVNNEALIKWSAVEEAHHDRYLVQRSTDGVDWNTISVKKPHQYDDLDYDLKFYSERDADLVSGWIYYRILDVCKRDIPESTSIEAIYVSDESTNSAQIFPNPAQKEFSVMHGPEEQSINLFDAQGKLLQSQRTVEGQRQTKMQVSDLHLNPGIYFLQLEGQRMQKLIIQ